MLYAPQTPLEAQTIIRGRNLYHPPTSGHKTGLSLSCMFNGQGLYETRRTRYRLDDSSYLLLNAGTDYRFSIDSPSPVESLSVVFPPTWVEEACACHRRQSADLLDEVDFAPGSSTVFETVYAHQGPVSQGISRLRWGLDQGPTAPAWLEEQLRLLLDAVVAGQVRLGRQIETLPAVRRSTRIELHRRLYLARDYIHSFFARPLRLGDMAQVAMLAPHHFLRSFKQAFGLTPHAYLVQRRLERARFLLGGTDMPVKQVCSAVGFSAVASFSTLFRQRCGVSPGAYRRQNSNIR
ncbi:MAG: helix-turn-helix domain-containing protein [Candidatus Latescibacteria bacterium]|nr:helix-turn-helix domain-containing protein [Candidatus Latescibacterota bacterium]